MVSRQDHGELMCWVSVDQALKQATRVKNHYASQDKIMLIKSWSKQLEWRIHYASQEIVMEFLEGQVVTKMIFIVELDMVMEESLVI